MSDDKCPQCGAKVNGAAGATLWWLCPQCHHEWPASPRARVSPAGAVQIGGDHYKTMAIQPFEYITANGIGYAEGSVIKYVSRWKAKNGVEDLKKARHFLDLLIEYTERKA